MAKRLSKKEKGFIKDYVKTGNATEAAAKNYDVSSRDVARSIGAENLAKPHIAAVVEKLADRLPDDLLEKNHKELFEQKRVDYFVFPKRMDDEEIFGHVDAAGLTVITIRESDKGKLAFYSVPDAQAKKAALDMAYKLKGSYAPDKSVNLNMEVKADDPMIQKLAEAINQKMKDELHS